MFLKRLIIILVLAISAAVSASDSYLPDTREAFSRTGVGAEFNDVGMVQPAAAISVYNDGATSEKDKRTGRFVASGVLIDPCQVITNYHVVFGDVKKPLNKEEGYRADFFIGANADGFGFANVVHGTVKYVGDFFSNKRDDDFVVIDFDECPGDSSIGFHNIEKFNADQGRDQDIRLTLVGYPDDLRSGGAVKAVLQRCKSLGYVPGSTTILTSCRSMPGSSGGPIFIERNGIYYLAGINEGGVPNYNKQHILLGYSSQAGSISHLIYSINRKYRTDFEREIMLYDDQYGTAIRPQKH